MTKKERVMKILAGEPVDRPATCFWRHYGNIGPQKTIEAHLDFLNATNMDILKMMCDEFFTYPIGDAKTPEDYMKLKAGGPNSEWVKGQIERATQINEALHGDIITFYNAFSPYSKMKHTIGDKQSMQLLRENEEIARHFMDVIAEDTCYMVEGMLKESGTTGMMLPVQGAEEGRFTADEYATLIAPYEIRVIETAEKYSENNMLHMCGWDGFANHLEWWDYDTKLISWAAFVENLDPAQAKAKYPGHVMVGGFDNRPNTLLTSGTKEDIQAYTKKIVADAGKENLIIGADCSLPREMDPVRIRWVVEALDEIAE